MRIHIWIILLLITINYGCKPLYCPEEVPHPPSFAITIKAGPEGKDANVTSFYPYRNFGTRQSLDGAAWTAGAFYIERGYIDFDLSNIPLGAVIKRASLKLYADTVTPFPHTKGHSTLSGPNDWVLQQVKSYWHEDSITWNTQPVTDPSTQIILPSSTCSSEPYSVDITDFIKEEFNTTGSYFGFCIKLNNEAYYREILFCSSDHPCPQLYPELFIEYEK